jgi:hypothetical protein
MSFSANAAMGVLKSSLPEREWGDTAFFKALRSKSYKATWRETSGLWGFSLSQKGVKINHCGRDSIELVIGSISPAAISEAIMSPDWGGVMHSTVQDSNYSWMSSSFSVRDTGFLMRSYIALGFTNASPGSSERKAKVSGAIVRLPYGWTVVKRSHLLGSVCCEGKTPAVYAEIRDDIRGKSAEMLIVGSSLFSKNEEAAVHVYLMQDGTAYELR